MEILLIGEPGMPRELSVVRRSDLFRKFFNTILNFYSVI